MRLGAAEGLGNRMLDEESPVWGPDIQNQRGGQWQEAREASEPHQARCRRPTWGQRVRGLCGRALVA